MAHIALSVTRARRCAGASYAAKPVLEPFFGIYRGRATPPPLRYNAFDAALPTDCFFHVLKFWRSDYGAASYLEPSPSRSDLLRAFYEHEHEEDSEEEDY